jgi:hypothetical protein
MEPLVYLFKIVKQSVISKRLLIIDWNCGDNLVQIVVHEGGLDSQVLPDMVKGVWSYQVLQRQEIKGM